MSEVAAVTLEFRPSPEPPPPTMLIRRNGSQVPIVMTEEEGFDLYVALKAHFEGDASAAEADR